MAIFVVSRGGEDDSMLAEDDTVHLLDIEFGFCEGQSKTDGSYVLSVDNYFFVLGDLFVLKASILAVELAISGYFKDGRVGDVVFDVIFFVARDSKLESDDRV